jgi:hypothetical protein
MRFHVEHQFAGPAEAVMGAMVDPELYRRLQLPDLSPPEVVGRQSDGGLTRLELRYTYVGRLDPIARRLVGSGQPRWRQDVQVDPAALTGRLSFASEDRGGRLHGEAGITFASDQAGTTRRIDGVLVVAVPIIGAMAERSILDGLIRRLDIEAEAIRSHLIGS